MALLADLLGFGRGSRYSPVLNAWPKFAFGGLQGAPEGIEAPSLNLPAVERAKADQNHGSMAPLPLGENMCVFARESGHTLVREA